MAENKTQPTAECVEEFVKSIDDEQVQADCFALIEIMEAMTQCPPVMWGSSIIGFGTYHYQYASGREGDFFLTGFSPRKKNISLYVIDCTESNQELLEKLGNVKHGKSCLYIKRLQDIHIPTLKKIIRQNVKKLKSKK